METISQIAERHIPKPNNKVVLTHPYGNTSDIISEILSIDKISRGETQKFSKHLKGSTDIATLYNDWKFVRDNIKYKLDPIDKQLIKTPARIWADKFADCKGISIFIGNLLRSQGYNFAYRFVSYTDKPIYTHVYIVAFLPEGSVIVDGVMNEFNKEKPYNFKKDLAMTQIFRMSGIDTERTSNLVKKEINLGKRDLANMTEGEMDLWLARDRMLTEKAIVERIQGIGSLKAERYQDTIDMIEDSIEAVQKHTVNGICGSPDDMEEELMTIAHHAITGVYSIAGRVHGIGSIAGKKEERKKRKAERKEIRKTYKGKEKREKMADWRAANGTKTGKFLQKVAQKVKKGMKAIAKVLSAPQRAIMKGILEVKLPKAAPAFIYLFVTDPALIAKLPTTARDKRAKAEKQAKFIINGLGMKEAHFMGIIRNGIMKQMGDSPENILAKEMGGKVSGIGFIEEAGKAASGFLTGIINWIISLFKKKKKKAPDGTETTEAGTPEDEQQVTLGESVLKSVSESLPQPGSEGETSQEVADGVRNQPSNNLNQGDDPVDDGRGSKSIWSSFGGN